MKEKNKREGVTELPSRFDAAPRPRSAPVPPGKLEQIVTYLEMRRHPARDHGPHRLENLALMRAQKPTLSFYRYLYETVGGPWLWYERRRLDDEALGNIIHHENVRIYVLYVGGVPAGFVELDARHEGEIELAYFGLVPEFIGRGLGQYFLDWSVDKAWSLEPRRVWVHTCNHDHPHAIAVYQRAGFVPYRQERIVIDDPRRGPLA